MLRGRPDIHILRRQIDAALPQGEGLPVLHDGGGRMPTEQDGRLLGIGADHLARPRTLLPYRNQGSYTRRTVPVTHRVAVLENEILRAEVLLDLGGRLWSLVDRRTGAELLHRPSAIRTGNLALRNAWFAGGIEWNLGMTGHWPLTMSPVSAAVVPTGEATVLRMWAFERMLELVWQVDLWLPAGADCLLVHVRLTNPHGDDRPVYWWSNMAVPQIDGGRVLVDADSAVHFGYGDGIDVVDIPFHDGVEVTRPTDNRTAGDFFFDVRERAHPWIAAVGPDGNGIAQSSTARLSGRKLFVWGRSCGGEHWQRWLSGPDGGYAEIQAGLARTQLEHLRLPAGRTWTWTESYRPVGITPELVGGPWGAAVDAMAREAVHADDLERAHEVLDRVAEHPVEGPWDEDRGAADNQGWGALAVRLGDLPQDRATPFDERCLGPEHRAWQDLATTGDVSPTLTSSALVGPQWVDRLERARPGGLQRLLLGYGHHAAGRTDLARELWQEAAADLDGPRAHRALGATSTDPARRADHYLAALRGSPSGMSWAEQDDLLVEALTALHEDSRDEFVLAMMPALPRRQRELPRVQYLTACALVALGRSQEARELIDLPLELPDVREGDVALDRLWFELQRQLGTDAPLPDHYDFRMFPVNGDPA